MRLTHNQLKALTGGRPRSKYRAEPTVYGGVRYASKAEASHASGLDLEVLAGRVRFWIGQPKFRLGVALNVYVADFLVVYIDGRVEAHDVKGVETAKFRRDRKLWATYGPCPLRIIGRRAEVIPGGSPCVA